MLFLGLADFTVSDGGALVSVNHDNIMVFSGQVLPAGQLEFRAIFSFFC